MNIKGQTALITGGAKRIGREIALEFARAGCHILLHYNTSETDAQKTRDEILKSGVNCDLFQADLSDETAIQGALKTNEDVVSRVSILINSASIFYKTPVKMVNAGQWDEFLKTNLTGAFYLARHIGLGLREGNRPGAIVNITDTSARRPFHDYLPYCASKAALENMTRSLALEVAPGVRVNAVAPGAVLFPDGYSEEAKAAIIKQVPLRRAGTPRDVAWACLFLVNSDYINAITLTVDGGRTP